MADFLSPEEKKQIGRDFISGVASSIDLAQQYGISDSLVRKYGKKVRDKKFFQPNEGRPFKLDPEHEEELHNFLNTNAISKTADQQLEKINE